LKRLFKPCHSVEFYLLFKKGDLVHHSGLEPASFEVRVRIEPTAAYSLKRAMGRLLKRLSLKNLF